MCLSPVITVRRFSHDHVLVICKCSNTTICSISDTKEIRKRSEALLDSFSLSLSLDSVGQAHTDLREGFVLTGSHTTQAG